PVILIFRARDCYTLCSVFTGKYFRPISITTIITVCIFSKPLWAFVIVFINDLSSDLGKLFHSVFKIIPIREWSRTRNNNNIWILVFYGIIKYFITRYIIRSPLFVPYTYILQIKWLRVPHVCSNLSPWCIYISIGEFN